MDKKLYDLMDWAEIEAVVYSEEDRPHDILEMCIRDRNSFFQ